MEQAKIEHFKTSKANGKESAGITFDELCELEPGLKKLYRFAGMIGRRRGRPFCANALWYEWFKPELEQLVGWGRKPSRGGKIKVVSFAEFIKMDFKNEDRSKPNPANCCKDPRLKTPEAYDIAYSTIYDRLPDCRGCRCL